MHRKIVPSAADGAADVEFAIVALLLLVLLFGIIEMGRLFNAYIVVSNSAREGTRLAVLGKNAAEIEGRVRDTFGLDDSGLVVQVVGEGGSPGSEVSVTVEYPVEFLPLIGQFFTDNKVDLTSTATMRLEP